jgi:hypothetical protein
VDDILTRRKTISKKENSKVLVTAASRSRSMIPSGFYLKQNNPNPFRGRTTIKFCLPFQSKVTVIITNSYGKVIDKKNSSVHDPGMYELEFFADGLSKGTYFCHLVADRYSESIEMELIK